MSENPQTEGEVREEYFENRPTGLEDEDNQRPPDDGVEPWDPDKIRVHTKHYSLRHIVDMIRDGDVDLASDFQRNFVWRDWQRWALIESLLLGVPLPSFYFNEDGAGRLQVVDGVQRLTAIYGYVTNPNVKLGKVSYLHELEGLCFDDLAAVFRRRLNGTQFVAHVIDPQTPYRVKFDIFRRINTTGSPLSSQEIRHCMSKPRSREFLKRLVNDESFVAATGGALHNHPRMADREVALRFVAFRLHSADDYAEYGNFDEFLGAVTEGLDDPETSDLDELQTDFVRGMTNAHTVFGDHAFRKWPWHQSRQSPINRALVESWGTVLADYSGAAVREGACDLVRRARNMMTNDQDFIESISGGTGQVRRIRTRLGKVREAAEAALS